MPISLIHNYHEQDGLQLQYLAIKGNGTAYKVVYFEMLL